MRVKEVESEQRVNYKREEKSCFRVEERCVETSSDNKLR